MMSLRDSSLTRLDFCRRALCHTGGVIDAREQALDVYPESLLAHPPAQ